MNSIQSQREERGAACSRQCNNACHVQCTACCQCPSGGHGGVHDDMKNSRMCHVSSGLQQLVSRTLVHPMVTASDPASLTGLSQRTITIEAWVTLRIAVAAQDWLRQVQRHACTCVLPGELCDAKDTTLDTAAHRLCDIANRVIAKVLGQHRWCWRSCCSCAAPLGQPCQS